MNNYAYDHLSHPNMTRDNSPYVTRQPNLFNMPDGQRTLDTDPHAMSLVFEQQQPFSMPLYQYDTQLRNRQMFFQTQPHNPTNNDTFYVNTACPQAVLPGTVDDYVGRNNGKYQGQVARQHANNEVEEISEEEKERQRVKREKNRIAAAKCRNRRREQLESLEKETDLLERENKNKRDILRSLHEESETLSKVLEEHESKCSKNIVYENQQNS